MPSCIEGGLESVGATNEESTGTCKVGNPEIRIARPAHVFFAGVLVALGILGLIKGDFTPVWQPVPKGLPGREVQAYLCAFIFLGCGIGLFLRRASATAARLLLGYLLLWMVARSTSMRMKAMAPADCKCMG
jgi:hypothetical protein